MIRIHCNKADAILKETQTLTAGMANYPEVQLTFSEDWDGLAKAAVVRAGAVVKDVVIIDNAFTVPAECLEDSGVNLIIGVHGVGDIGLPTVWCACGEILDGTDIDEADNVGTATPTLVDQLRVYAENADEAADEALANIIRSVAADLTHINEFGTANVSVSLSDDAVHGGKKLLFAFEYLKGNGIDSFTIATDGTVQVRLTDGTITNYTGLKEALADIAELIEDVEAAESTRQTNESSRISAETGRVNAEDARELAEEGREDAEDDRVSAESSRVTAESGRVTAETGRTSAETARVSAESARVTAENSRASAETARASAESSRATAETNRVNAESTRSTNETTRASNEATRINSENSRISAETSRVSAESARSSAESTRVSNETSRVSAETARASAESARATAESGRTTAESGRVTAEAARVSAEEERATEFATWEETIASKADAAEVEAQFTEQSQQIAALDSSKADKATEDARYKKQQTEIQFLLDAAKGQIAEVVTDDDEAYSKAVPSYTGGTAKFADVKKLGGKSVVWNQTGRTDYNSREINGLKITNNGDGSVSVVGTCTSTNNYSLFASSAVFADGETLIRGPLATSDYYLVSSPISKRQEEGDDWLISTNPSNIQFHAIAGAEVDVTFKIEAISLTKWFGSSIAETITTAEQAYALGVPREYIPYNAGSIISADCDEVVSEGKNLISKLERNESVSPPFSDAVYVKAGTYTLAVTNIQNATSWRFGLRTFDKNGVSNTSDLIAIVPHFTYYSNGDKIMNGSNVTSKNIVITISEDCYIAFAIGAGDTTNATIAVEPRLTLGETVSPYSPYMTDSMLIPAGLRTAHPLRSAGTVHDEYNLSRKYTIKRADVGIIGDNILFDTIDTASTGIRYGMTPSGSFSKFVQGTLNILDNRGDAPVSGAPISSGAIRTVINAIAIYDNAFTDLDTANAIITANHITLIGELATPVYYYDPTSPELAVNGGTIVPDATHIVDPESYFPDGTYLPVEDGGSLTFHQTATEFPVPNEEDFYYVLEGASA